MKTTLDLADPLFHAAKALAAQQKTTMRSLVEEGLRLVLEQRKKTAAKPYVLPDCSVKGEVFAPYSLQQINDDYTMARFLRVEAYVKEDMEATRLKQAAQDAQKAAA